MIRSVRAMVVAVLVLATWSLSALVAQTRRVATAVNEAAGGCQWLGDNRRLLCLTVPVGRGPAPVEPRAPAGPTVQESQGREAPVRTFQDLLQNAYDDALFAYYMTSQPALRIEVGGHSYGAFMTANLLAHSDLFRAGIAHSLRVPERATHLLGSARRILRHVALHARSPHQPADPSHPRRG
jgi:hypothetical protein